MRRGEDLRELRDLMAHAVRAGFEALAERDQARHAAPPSSRRPVGEAEDERIALPGRLGRYAVLEEIGRGGVGVVYRAHDEDLDRDVAIKVLKPRHAADDGVVRRFGAEARMCASLEHPGIVPVHEIGRLDDGRPYFTMRLVGGRGLEEVAPELTRHRLVTLFGEIAEVVAYAHAHGVVHGDLKPSNILLGKAGDIQVVDWGFTRSLVSRTGSDGEDGRLRVVGTPGYMAPEQLSATGTAASRETDVFGLGAILFELLCGRRLADAAGITPTRATAAPAAEQIALTHLASAGAEEPLIALVADCVAHDPQRRPAAVDVARRVAEHLDGVARRNHALELSAAAAEDRARAAARVRSRTVALAVCAVVLMAVLGWTELARRDRAAADIAAVGRSTARASHLLEVARAAPTPVTAPWDEVLGLVRNAAELARDRDVAQPIRSEIAALEQEVLVARAAAARDHEMLARLETVRDHYADDLLDDARPARYRHAFIAYGLTLDPERGAADAAAIRTSTIAEQLTVALDDWYLLAPRATPADLAFAEHLQSLAQTADDDPVRRALRAAFVAQDVDALLAVVAEPGFVQSSPTTIGLAARHLATHGRRDEAIALYRRGRTVHPDDFALTHELAAMLSGRGAGDRPEVLALMAATVAILPRSPHTWTDYAVAAFQAGLPSVGEEALARALELDPRYARAMAWTGKRLYDAGDRLGGARLLADSLRIQPANLAAWNALGAVLSWEGLVFAARTCFERGLALAPDNPVILSNLGLEQLKLRDGEGALEHLRAAARLRPPTAAQLCSTGYALLLVGEFEAACDAMSAGHALAATDPGWRYPSGAWAERLRAVRDRAARSATEHEAGTGMPGDVLEVAWITWLSGDAARAATLYGIAADADPTALRTDAWIDAEHPWREPHVACAATAALRAGHVPGPAIADEDRARFRALAHRFVDSWLDLVEELGEAPASRPRARDTLCRIAHELTRFAADPALAEVSARVRELTAVLSADFAVRLPGS